MLEEKERNKREEEEEKARKKKEREEKQLAREEEKKKKAQEREAKKALQQAKKIEQQAKKAELQAKRAKQRAKKAEQARKQKGRSLLVSVLLAIRENCLRGLQKPILRGKEWKGLALLQVKKVFRIRVMCALGCTVMISMKMAVSWMGMTGFNVVKMYVVCGVMFSVLKGLVVALFVLPVKMCSFRLLLFVCHCTLLCHYSYSFDLYITKFCSWYLDIIMLKVVLQIM